MWKISLVKEFSVPGTKKRQDKILGSDLYCRNAYKYLLKDFGEAMVDYCNYKESSESVIYNYEIKKSKGCASKLLVMSDVDTTEATERNICYLEEAKIAKRRYCLVEA
jgi:hypothetical protein